MGRLPVKSSRSFGAKAVVPMEKVKTSYPVMLTPNKGAPLPPKLPLGQAFWPEVVPMSHATILPNWKELLAKGPRPILAYRSPEVISPPVEGTAPPTEMVEVAPPGYGAYIVEVPPTVGELVEPV